MSIFPDKINFFFDAENKVMDAEEQVAETISFSGVDVFSAIVLLSLLFGAFVVMLTILFQPVYLAFRLSCFSAAVAYDLHFSVQNFPKH